jgi:molybdopterin-guanine dinucleotide biosynthesis protein A
MPEDPGNTDTAPSDETRHDRDRVPEYRGNRIPGVTAVVLAGGMSRRYGKNKALVRVDGVSLIERVVRTLQRVFDRVVLSANDPDLYAFLHLQVIRDVYPGVGQLGGVHAGLFGINDETGFFVACDMPFLNPQLITYMAGLTAGWDAVVPKIGANLEPLHAFYGKTCLSAIVRAIERRERRIVSFFPDIRVRFVEEREIRRIEPGLDAFTNINRPRELVESMDRIRQRI